LLTIAEDEKDLDAKGQGTDPWIRWVRIKNFTEDYSLTVLATTFHRNQCPSILHLNNHGESCSVLGRGAVHHNPVGQLGQDNPRRAASLLLNHTAENCRPKAVQRSNPRRHLESKEWTINMYKYDRLTHPEILINQSKLV
jgi:hypothetical protein